MIRLKVKRIDKNVIFFFIEEQTDFNLMICKKEQAFGPYFKASNGILIGKDSFPAFYPYYNKFYVRGSEKHRDKDLIKVTLYQYKKIYEAVKEYNESERNFYA